MNLQDRMNSGSQNLRQNANAKLQESEKKTNLPDTTAKSNLPSPEELLARQSEALKIVTEERDLLQSKGRPQDTQRIQDLSSEISELKSAIAELRAELSDTQKLNQSLTSNNQLLTQSNDELRSNNGLMLRKEQEKLKQSLEASEARVSACKEQYKHDIHEIQQECEEQVNRANRRADEAEHRFEKDNAAAAEALRKGKAYEKRYKQLLENETSHIDALAESKIAKTVEVLNIDKERAVSRIKKKYKNDLEADRTSIQARYLAKEGWHGFVFTFCILYSTIQAICSSAVRAEFGTAFVYIWDLFLQIFNTLDDWTIFVADLAAGLADGMTSSILYWVVYIFIGLLLLLVLQILPILAGIIINVRYLRSKYYDKPSQWIMIGSGLFLIAMTAEHFLSIPVNILLLWSLVQISVPIIRYVLIPLAARYTEKLNSMDYYEQRNHRIKVLAVLAIIGVSVFGIWLVSSIF